MKAKHLLLCVVLLIISASSFAQTDMTDRLLQMKEDLTNAKNEIRRLKTDSTNLARARKNDSIRLTTARKTDSTKYAQRHRSDSTKLVQVKTQLEATQQKLNDANSELTKLRSSANSIKATESEVKTLKNRVKTLEDQAADAKREYEAVITQKNSEILGLRQEIAGAKNTNARIKQVQAERDSCVDKLLVFIRRDVANWKTRAFSTIASNDIKNAIERYEEIKISDIKEQIADLIADMQTLSTEYETYQNAVQVLKNKYDAQKVQEASKAITQLSSKSTGPKSDELDDLATKLAVYRKYVEAAQNVIKYLDNLIENGEWAEFQQTITSEEDKTYQTLLKKVEKMGDMRNDAPWLYREFKTYQDNLVNIFNSSKNKKKDLYDAGTVIRDIQL